MSDVICPDLFRSGLICGLSVVPIACVITAAIIYERTNRRWWATRSKREEELAAQRDEACDERNRASIEASKLRDIIRHAANKAGVV